MFNLYCDSQPELNGYSQKVQASVCTLRTLWWNGTNDWEAVSCHSDSQSPNSNSSILSAVLLHRTAYFLCFWINIWGKIYAGFTKFSSAGFRGVKTPDETGTDSETVDIQWRLKYLENIYKVAVTSLTIVPREKTWSAPSWIKALWPSFHF